MFRLLFSRRWWWTTLIVIAGIGLAIRLGIWQLDRHASRQTAVSHIQAVQAMPVLDLTQRPIPTDLETMEYRQVTATGIYDFNHQVALRNQVRSRMSGTDPGYRPDHTSHSAGWPGGVGGTGLDSSRLQHAGILATVR